MIIYIADDERLIREDEISIIKQLLPEAEITGFPSGEELLKAAREKACEIAFLDIQMTGLTGIETAQKLRRLIPDVNVIFCTAYDDHYREAMEMHASGYLLKPIMKQDVQKELQDLRYTQEPEKKSDKLKVYCIGNFDVRLPDGSPLHFKRSRAKEAFAYLVDRQGRPCTLREMAAALFEDEPFDKKNQQYMQKILSSMMETLRENGMENVVEKTFNHMAVLPDKLECDYYEWLKERRGTEYQVPDRYMEQYSWTDFS